jgi:hypothetical protein
MDDSSTLPAPIDAGARRVSTFNQLADIPEEEIWLQKQKSARTRRAYRLDAPTRSTAWCANTRASSGSTAVTRRTRCARPSSPPRSKTGHSSRTCKRPPDTAIREQRSSMIAAATTLKRRRASLRRTKSTR